MKIHTFPQGSEQWEQIRKGKATASRFKDIVTAKKLELSASSKKYAAELIAERLGIESPEWHGTQWMENGRQSEKFAVREFEESQQVEVQRVGFCEWSADIGCSPDGLIGEHEALEVKCPKIETLIQWHLDKQLPSEYMMQVQGTLWITGRSHCHFYGWHPETFPFHTIVQRDEHVIGVLSQRVVGFMESVKYMQRLISKRSPPSDFVTVWSDGLDWSE